MRFTHHPHRFLAACAMAVCGISVTAANAAILADYRFAANPTNSEPLLTDSTAGTITYSGGVTQFWQVGMGDTVTSIASTGGLRATASITDASSTTDTAGAIVAGDYISFTLTPGTGKSLDFDDLQFYWVIQRDSAAGNTDPSPFSALAFLKSSLGGFTDADPTLGAATHSSTVFGISASNPWTNVIFDLSSLPATASPVEFRLYFADNGGWTNSHIRLDNLVVNGSVIPEPASIAMFAMAGLLLRHRRR